jgi:hypothetical protein
MSENRLRGTFEERASEMSLPETIPHRTLTRARRLTLVVGAVAMSLAVAGALGAYAVTNLTETGSPAPPAGRVADLPSTAEVICTDAGATAVTPVVRPQRDGVHIVFDNRTDRREFYVRAAAASEPNQGGTLARNAKTPVL